jgi:hypothetical protein
MEVSVSAEASQLIHEAVAKMHKKQNSTKSHRRTLNINAVTVS